MNPNEETQVESQARVEQEVPEAPSQEPTGTPGGDGPDTLDAPQEGPAG